MKTIVIKDFSIEISDDIVEDFYADLSDEELVDKVVDEVQKLGFFMCFDNYEVENG